MNEYNLNMLRTPENEDYGIFDEQVELAKKLKLKIIAINYGAVTLSNNINDFFDHKTFLSDIKDFLNDYKFKIEYPSYSSNTVMNWSRNVVSKSTFKLVQGSSNNEHNNKVNRTKDFIFDLIPISSNEKINEGTRSTNNEKEFILKLSLFLFWAYNNSNFLNKKLIVFPSLYEEISYRGHEDDWDGFLDSDSVEFSLGKICDNAYKDTYDIWYKSIFKAIKKYKASVFDNDAEKKFFQDCAERKSSMSDLKEKLSQLLDASKLDTTNSKSKSVQNKAMLLDKKIFGKDNEYESTAWKSYKIPKFIYDQLIHGGNHYNGVLKRLKDFKSEFINGYECCKFLEVDFNNLLTFKNSQDIGPMTKFTSLMSLIYQLSSIKDMKDYGMTEKHTLLHQNNDSVKFEFYVYEKNKEDLNFSQTVAYFHKIIYQNNKSFEINILQKFYENYNKAKEFITRKYEKDLTRWIFNRLYDINGFIEHIKGSQYQKVFIIEEMIEPPLPWGDVGCFDVFMEFLRKLEQGLPKGYTLTEYSCIMNKKPEPEKYAIHINFNTSIFIQKSENSGLDLMEKKYKATDIYKRYYTEEVYSIYSISNNDESSKRYLKSLDEKDPIYDRFNSTQQTTSDVQYSSEMDETEEFYLHDLQRIPLVNHYINELHMSPKTAVNVIEAFLAENPYLNMYLINESSFKTQEAYDDALLDAFIAATEASNGNIELYNDALDYSTEFFYNLDEAFYTEESVVRNRGIIDRAKHSIKKTLSPIAQNIVNQVDALIGDKAAKEEVITGSSLLKARRLFLKMIVMWKVPAILSALSILPGGWLGLILKIVIWVGSKASSLGAMKNLVSTGTGLGNGNDAVHDENTKLVLNELDLELKITREKIDDAKSKGDTKAKYQLMRIENNIEREIFRIKYGKTPDRSFVGERGH